MKPIKYYLPSAIIFSLILIGMIYGPISQPLSYHDFADISTIWNIPHAGDVLSNLGFMLVGVLGLCFLMPKFQSEELKKAKSGYTLFFIGLILTGLGSSWYHLDPNNMSLIWDRIPISLTCAGLITGVIADTQKKSTFLLTITLAILSIFSVIWWYLSEIYYVEDLRLYLIFQIAALVLIPLWQWIYERPALERFYFWGAVLLYVLAKFAEMYDYEVASVLVVTTGHTAKHLFATLAAVVIFLQLKMRIEQS